MRGDPLVGDWITFLYEDEPLAAYIREISVVRNGRVLLYTYHGAWWLHEEWITWIRGAAPNNEAVDALRAAQALALPLPLVVRE